MPTIESVKNDIEALGTAGQEEILHYLEEVFVLGSFATEVTNEVKETIGKTLLLQFHEKSIKEVLRVVIAVKMKREKEVSQRNRYAFYVLWIEQEILLLNLYVLV